MRNIHEDIGWFRCANVKCQTELSRDHVTVTTTTKVRRFCSVDCVTEGHQAHLAEVAALPLSSTERS